MIPARENHWQPGELWSLWDLLKLEVGRLLELHENLVLEKGYYERAYRQLDKAGIGHIRPEPHHFRKLQDSVAEVEKIAAVAKLDSTWRAARRTRQFLSQIQLRSTLGEGYLVMQAEGCGNVFRHLMDICSRIRDDCEGRWYFQIPPENAELLRQDAQHFGDQVERAFGTAAEDIAEAASCLAFGRNTACVFHLMRALEIAAAAVAQKLGVTIVDDSGRGLAWGVIANNMKSKIDKMPKGSDAQIAWYRVQSHLEVVNRAWRVPTAHPKHTYTDEQARAVFDATKSFMQDLAPLVNPAPGESS